MNTHTIDPNDLFSVEDMAGRYPHILSTSTMRYQLRNREQNGLARACIRIGKRLLISDTGYRVWLAEMQEKQGGSK